MSGIDSIIVMIEQKTSEKIDKIIQNAKEERAARLERAEQEAKNIKNEIIASAQREANAALKRYEANAKLKAKQRILSIKSKLINETLEETITRAKGVVKKKEYPKLLQRFIIEGAKVLEVPELELVLPKGQQALLDLKVITKAVESAIGKKVKITFAKETVRATGGVIVRTPDKRKWVDNTIEARIERFEDEIRNTIASMLFGRKK